MARKKYHVNLSEAETQKPEGMTTKGTMKVRKFKRGGVTPEKWTHWGLWNWHSLNVQQHAAQSRLGKDTPVLSGGGEDYTNLQ